MNKEKDNKLLIADYKNEFYFEKKTFFSFNRLAFIFFLIIILSILYSTRVFYLASKNANDPINEKSINNNLRSDIVDINGNFIAKTVITHNVGINPTLIKDKKKLLIKLKFTFPNKNFSEIEKKMKLNKFFYLEKKITPRKLKKLKLLGEKSIILEQSISRIYPQKNLFSHLVGQIDDNNLGVSGIEKSFDNHLKKVQEPIILTLDKNIQFIIRQELVQSSKIFKNVGSGALLMDIDSGKIISLVSLPDFDINKRNNISDPKFINRVTKGLYEFGSVFKPFTLSAALDTKKIEPDKIFKNLEKKINCGGRSISEYDLELPGDMSAEQIIVRSGNIGAVKIGEKVGKKEMESFLKKIGIIGKIDFDIEEVGSPQKINWGKCKLQTVSFGHGITTTLLQIAKAYAIISNGGYDINPTVIYEPEKIIPKKKRILSSDVTKKINPILRKVVREGTASLADVDGYQIGGKTGTAQLVENGKYTKKKINSFASVFPMNDPKYVFVMFLEDTKLSKDYIYKYRNKTGSYKGTPFNTAGWTTVEIAGKIFDRIGPILATKY